MGTVGTMGTTYRKPFIQAIFFVPVLVPALKQTGTPTKKGF